MLVFVLLIVGHGLAMSCLNEKDFNLKGYNRILDDPPFPAEIFPTEKELQEFLNKVEAARKISKHILSYSFCLKADDKYTLYTHGFRKYFAPPNQKIIDNFNCQRTRAILFGLIGLRQDLDLPFFSDPNDSTIFYNLRSKRALFSLRGLTGNQNNYQCKWEEKKWGKGYDCRQYDTDECTWSEKKSGRGAACTLISLVDNFNPDEPFIRAVKAYAGNPDSLFNKHEWITILMRLSHFLIFNPILYHEKIRIMASPDVYTQNGHRRLALKFSPTTNPLEVEVMLDSTRKYVMDAGETLHSINAFVCRNYAECVAVQDITNREAFMEPPPDNKQYSLGVKKTSVTINNQWECLVYFIVTEVDKNSDPVSELTKIIFYNQDNNVGVCENTHGKFSFLSDLYNSPQKLLDLKQWGINELKINGRVFSQMNIYTKFDPNETSEKSCFHFKSITKDLLYMRRSGQHLAKNEKGEVLLVTSNFNFHIKDPVKWVSNNENSVIWVFEEGKFDVKGIGLIQPDGTAVYHSGFSFIEIEVKISDEELEPVYFKKFADSVTDLGHFEFRLAQYPKHSFFMIPTPMDDKSLSMMTIKGFEFALGKFDLYKEVKPEFPGVYYAVESKTRKIAVFLCHGKPQEKKNCRIVKETTIPEDKNTYNIRLKDSDHDRDLLKLGDESNYYYLSNDKKFLVNGLKIELMKEYKFTDSCFYFSEIAKDSSDDLIMNFKPCNIVYTKVGNMKKFAELDNLCNTKLWREYSGAFCDGRII